MATLNGLPISVHEILRCKEIALIFELYVKDNILGDETRKLERETGLSDYEGLRMVREHLEDRHKVCGLSRIASDLADDYKAYARVSG